ncbi:MAG: U32 family peptidase [Bacteroidales bacterium]|nr:U32 family peptidase [Bacteroidales bacterium]
MKRKAVTCNMTTTLELLSPAKNLEQGKAAIDHGADAVYTGAPLFGARVAAGNSIEDIEELVRYAHIFGSKVFATVNTLLFDNELEEARRLMWQLYNAGVDAAIVQDMGLLELDLPPIELHASTQTHNYDPRRIKFLEQVGFKRIILARETSLEQMKALRQTVTADLEAFVQGALCVCYSGQCYMSLYLNGRSGNRGSCSQPCRSSYDLVNEQRKTLKHNEHLLSLKDFSAAQHIESMIDAGITSYKIEGRLKNLAYVKNVTAYYRQLLDSIIARREGLKPSSSGTTKYYFTPDLERTFNRGFTDYFLQKRQPMASTTTQKSLGKKIGTVVSANGNRLIANFNDAVSTGDGICFFNDEKQLEGFLVNNIAGNTVTANKPLNIKAGTTLWRNNDHAFEKQLQAKSAERKVAVSMTLTETETGLQLTVEDQDGCCASASIECEKAPARDEAKAIDGAKTQLAKLGGTPFGINTITIQTEQPYFIPAALLNDLRRKAVETLSETRLAHFHPKDTLLISNEIPYYEDNLGGRANIVNSKAEAFYRRHGVTSIERGPDQPVKSFEKGFPLMTTKYCLRYELGQCLMHKCNKSVTADYASGLYLVNNGRRFRLHFDCQRCEMQILPL